MDLRFSCRVELAQHIVPSGRAATFSAILEPFDGHVMRLPDGRVYVDVVVPAHDVGEAAAQSVHLVRYAGRCAQLPSRALAVLALPAADGPADDSEDGIGAADHTPVAPGEPERTGT